MKEIKTLKDIEEYAYELSALGFPLKRNAFITINFRSEDLHNIVRNIIGKDKFVTMLDLNIHNEFRISTKVGIDFLLHRNV